MCEERLWEQLVGLKDVSVVPELLTILRRKNDQQSIDRLMKEINKQLDYFEEEVKKRKVLTRQLLADFFPPF